MTLPRLEVRVHDAARMRALQRARHAHRSAATPRETAFPEGTPANQRAQIRAVDVLHRHENDRAVLVEIVDVHDVVVEASQLQAARFALQGNQRIRVAAEPSLSTFTAT